MRHVHRLALAAMLSLPLSAIAPAAPSVALKPAASSEQIAELDALNKQVAEQTQAANYAEALALAETVAEKARASLGEESTQYARAISWQAYLLQLRGRLLRAEPLFQKSLAIYEKILPAGHPDVATAINNLGFHYQSTDKLEQAEALYKRALEMREKALPPDDPLIADSLNNVAQAYKRQGRIAEAEPLLKRSLEIRAKSLPADDPLIAQSLTNIGSTIEMQGRFKDAEPYYRKAMDIRRKSQVADHPEIAGLINKLAQNLSKQGRFAEADTLFREAVEMRYRVQSADHPEIATTLNDSAVNLIGLKKYTDAKSQLRNALAIRQTVLPPLDPQIAETQTALAKVSLAEGQPEQALALIRVAVVSLAARGKHDDLAKQTYSDFVSIAWQVYQKQGARPDSRVFTEALEMAQRASFTETEAEVARMTARFASNDDKLEAVIRDRQELERETARLEKELSAALAIPTADRGPLADDIRARMVSISTRTKAIDADVRKRFPNYFELVKPEPITVDEMRAMLDPGEVLVYFLSAANDEMFVWAVSKEQAAWAKLDTSYPEISRSVVKLRTALDIESLLKQGKSPALYDLSLSHQMYKWLLKPVEGVMAGKADLIVVPSGPLTSLPFQMLVRDSPAIGKPKLTQLATYRDADWLMRHYAISVLPAATSLKSLRGTATEPGARKPFVGFGNPVFSRDRAGDGGVTVDPPTMSGMAGLSQSKPQTASYASFWRGPAANLDALRSGLPPLPETESELKSVANRLQAEATDIVLGPNATEAMVKRTDLSRYRVVYFATHGLVAGEVKGLGEPALAFTVPDQPTELDDGLLTASEVSQLRLNADWVILSACNTAAGGAPGAEALSGLAKSFFHAGARALLVSHWRIGSQAAARITTSAFEAQHKSPGIGRAEALRQAMLELMSDQSDPWNAYPTFWAAFMVVGDGHGSRMIQ